MIGISFASKNYPYLKNSLLHMARRGGGIYFVEQLPKIINTKKVCFQWLGETFFSKLRIFSID